MASDIDLCVAFVDAHPEDAARALEQLPTVQVVALIEALPADTAARGVTMMTPMSAAACLTRLDPRAAAAVVAGLRIDYASMLLRQIDDASRMAILEQLPSDEARMLAARLRYPEGTAGALMDPRVVVCASESTAGDALALMRRFPRHLCDYLYVVDRDQRLVGVVDPGALIGARPAESIARLMTAAVGRVPAHAGRAAILAHPAWSQFRALPVVDEALAIVGAISYQTYRALEEKTGNPRQPDVVTTVFAIGELYWLSLSGMIDGVASVVRRVGSRADLPAEETHGVH